VSKDALIAAIGSQAVLYIPLSDIDGPRILAGVPDDINSNRLDAFEAREGLKLKPIAGSVFDPTKAPHLFIPSWRTSLDLESENRKGSPLSSSPARFNESGD
jgi:hypothetical protein